jgi:hypothetical protein
MDAGEVFGRIVLLPSRGAAPLPGNVRTPLKLYGVMNAKRAGWVVIRSFLPGAGMTDVLVGSGSQPGPASG